MSEDNCARLEKIQGGVDLINERLKHSNQLQDERHHAIRKDIDGLSGRVGVLESESDQRIGMGKGIGLAAKVLPFLGGGAAMAVAALVARAAGL